MGKYDPINIIFYNRKLAVFWGDLTDTSAETKTLIATYWMLSLADVTVKNPGMLYFYDVRECC